MSYHTETESILDMVERGCRRLMKEGGGALPTEKPNSVGAKRITPEQTQQIIELATGGKHSQGEIAAIIGVSKPAISKAMKRAGVKLPDHRRLRQPKGNLELARSMAYSRMYSHRQIREITGCGFSTVYRLISQRNTMGREGIAA